MAVLAKHEVVHLKLAREVYEAVRKIAEAEQRSIHNTTRVLLNEALAAREKK